ncbi:MAG: class I SAM-dependent methyltransferase [Gaiellaceae bacterium]
MGGSEFTPEDFLELMHEEIPLYDELQEQTAAATADIPARRILELGFGTGETTRRVLALHPGATLLGLDGSSRMLAAIDVPGAEFRRAELTDPLPEGPFDLVVSCLTVHHVDAKAKRDLFARIAAVSEWLVLGDVVVPGNPAEAVVPIEPNYDLPDTVQDQLVWLREAGFEAETTWTRGDLAVVRARRLPQSRRSRWRIPARFRRGPAT